jgi:hypothetical protein
VTGRGRQVEEWQLQPGGDNDWLDTLVLVAVAVSVQGLTFSSAVAAGQPAGEPTRRSP